MKKKLYNILGRIAVLAVFAGCVEAADGSITTWTYACLAVAIAAGLGLKKMEERRNG